MLYPATRDRDGSHKGCTRGTHRTVAPVDTIARVAPVMPVAGITRVGVITGLDHIGLPVVAVYRPNARSLAVSQGKGLDLDAARASGIMEALESWHAEYVSLPLRYASWTELAATQPVVDVSRLPRLSVGTFHHHKSLLWTEARDLVSGEQTWVPFEMVHTNFTLPLPAGSGSFVMSSNGLASGNHMLEATIHGICELVERDANALWFAGDASVRAACRIDPSTVDDPDCRLVLNLFAAADIAVAIWDTTSDIGLASFRCVVVDRQPNVFRQLYAVDGSGCHPAREIALLRALTEAAQCRLTYISGARDDGDREFFERVRNAATVARARDEVDNARPTRPFQDVPTRLTANCADDVVWACEQLGRVGIDEVAVVDLTKVDIGIPVVRLIIPGLEALHDAPGYAPGARVCGAGTLYVMRATPSTSVVFVGPTVPVDECREVLDAIYLPPVSQGDVYRAALDRPSAIGIIDGYFERVPAVWHKEILWAMAQGIHVFGAASMGALRAAELSPFGMTGVGRIFEAFRDGQLEADDEVAIVHADAAAGYAAGSVALVDIRATLTAAEAAGVISAPIAAAVVGMGKALFYPERSYSALVDCARAHGLPEAEIASLDAWLPDGRVSQKREDALTMLRVMHHWHTTAPSPRAVDYHFEHTDAWEQLVNRSGRGRAAVPRDDVPHQLLLEELQLDRDAYERAIAGAFAHALALVEAARHDIEVSPALVTDAITALRRAHALVDADALPRWIAEQDLDVSGFAELMEQQARIGWVRTMFEPDVVRHLRNWLRASGRYSAIAARAHDKQRVLADHGLDAPTLGAAAVDDAGLLRWFFEEQRGIPVPARLDLHAHAVGYPNRGAFMRALLREYHYVTLRQTDPSG